MRFDNIGIFWKDLPTKGSRNTIHVMPNIPDTGWTAPKEFPNLKIAKIISFDVETYDPNMIKKGPGWARKDGHIVGVAVGADNDGRWYFPVRHEIEPEHNLDPIHVFKWLKDTLNNPSQPKIGANLMYDIGWLAEENIQVCGQLFDVQFAEALLNETGLVNLDHLSNKYLNLHKETELLYQWCADYYGGSVNHKQRANIYRSPARLVGPYAESDVDLPLRIIKKQFSLLEKEQLSQLFYRENKLIPLLIRMRKKGVRIDLDKAEKLSQKLNKRICILKDKLRGIAKRPINVYASNDLAKVFDELELEYPLTEKGNPSFTKGFLETQDYEIVKVILEIKKLDKLKNVFIDSYLLESHINGYIHCQFHPLRGDEYGTRSGRFSSSHPNLQNIPIRDKIFGPLLRSLFVPDENHVQWYKQDASQIEYRFLAHYAVGTDSDLVRQKYKENPETDYHQFTQDLIKQQTNVELGRKPTKNINFGFIYGMGKPTLAKNLKVTKKKAEKLFEAYHKGAPFVKATMDHYITTAKELGYVKTIKNRRSRFDLFEPIWQSHEKRAPALRYDKALSIYGLNIQRAYTHKALNRVLQGSAAELIKETMLQCDEAGLFDIIVPKLTVHDELDFSDPGGMHKTFKEIKNIFEQAIKIKVPILVDEEIGPDWGNVKEVPK